MKFSDIRIMPRELVTDDLRETLMWKDDNGYYHRKLNAPVGFHESLTRSYHVVQKIKELLQAECPAALLLEIIEDLEAAR